MSNRKYKNSPSANKDKNTISISGNSLDKYFSSPNTTKKRKKSSTSNSNSGSPPAKKMDKEVLSPKVTGTVTPSTSTTTPTSDKVCKHLDTQLNDMEKRLETSLSATLSASITASVTAGLKDLIDMSLKTALETMKNSVDTAIKSNPTVKLHGEQLDSLETENLLLKAKMSTIEGEQTQLKRRLANVENRALQQNLIFRGIKEEEKEKESTSRHKVYTELTSIVGSETDTKEKKMELAKQLEIRSCKRVGKYIKDRARPISAEFVRRDDVDHILSNKSNLKKGIFAEKEYPQEIEKKRKILRPIYTAAKNSRKYKKQCRMENDLLVIKAKRYGVEDIQTLPKSLKPENVTSRVNSTVFRYFGELNPLSNFYQSEFTIDGKRFHCSKQYIQWKKAELFKDNKAMRRIEQAKTGQKCKEEGRNINNFKSSTWERNAIKLCKPGIKQKFIENAIPRNVLLKKTKGKRIVECTKDTVWGCGMALKDDNCLNTMKWTNQGIMGQMLEEIRTELTPFPSGQAASTISANHSISANDNMISTNDRINTSATPDDPTGKTNESQTNTDDSSGESSSSSSESDNEMQE